MNKLAVVSYVSQRPMLLRQTIEQIENQIFPVDFYLVCNNESLEDFVEEQVKDSKIDITVFYNQGDFGRFSSIETMHYLANSYDFFLAIDDNCKFDEFWSLRWWQQKDENVMKGWTGYNFSGDYWNKTQVKTGDFCHMLSGDNLLVPVEAVISSQVLQIPEKYRSIADDLWLSYHANHVAGLKLQVGNDKIGVKKETKEVYQNVKRSKTIFLNELRKKGWEV